MKNRIHELFAGVIKKLGVDDAEIQIEFPEQPVHGEFTTNIAMLLSKRLKAPPREIAQKIIDHIKTSQTASGIEWLRTIDIAGPGFINIAVTDSCFSTVLESVLKEKELYGASKFSIFNLQFSNNSKKIQAQNATEFSEAAHNKSHKKNVDKKGKTSAGSVDDAGKVDESAPIASRGDSKTIMVEFAHPNTHKAFHIGHLRNITTGETIVRLLESQGKRVIRANYQGDVGMHIAKAMYALLELSPFKDDVDNVKGIKARVEFLGKAYAAGSSAFEEDEKAQGIIKDLNALVYASAQQYAKEVGRNPGTTDYLKLVVNHVHPLERVYTLWKETRQWSLDYFDTVYARVNTHYDRFYFESECLSGVDTAKEAVKKGVLEASDGAIIFRGKDGLDTRVFVNNLGLPTYEAKELALAPMEVSEHGELFKIIHCVGPEQASFFKVTFKVEELLGIVKPDVQYHLTYGWVKLKEGKMSSRTGNVVLGEWLIEEVKKAIQSIMDSNTLKQLDIDMDATTEALAIGAIKYAFLKVSTNQEIAFDLKESINTNGDSGPYLMYCYARARSVLRKANISDLSRLSNLSNLELNNEERLVVRLIMQFPDLVKKAADNYAPNVVCTYLFQLAQTFNSFYANNPIMENNQRLAITASCAQVLKNGLNLLGITVLERM